MSATAYRKVLLLGIVSLLGVISYQGYLFLNYSELTQQRQEDQIVASLYQVVDDLYQINPEAGKIANSVRKISQGAYRVQVNDTLHPYLLENLLTKNFSEYNLELPFEYAIYDCFTDSTVFASQVNPSRTKKQTDFIQKIDWKTDGHYFGVYFPSLPNAWLNLPVILRLSSILLGILLLFFGYTLWIVLKEKRLHTVKYDFINNVTHQLKTPVSALVLGVKALENSPSNSERYIGIIKKEALQLKHIINQVLWASKTENGQNQSPTQKINLHAFISQWAETKERSVHLSGHENITVLGVPDLLTTVLDNLYDNSLVHNPEPVSLAINVELTGRRAIIHYRDTGRGIPEKFSKQIFEKFHSGNDMQTNEPRKGFGLGLYICKQALKNMGGQIALQPSTSGVHFTITLPTVYT